MYFDSLAQVIQMDGHRAFVWSAYAISLAVLAILLVAPWRRSRRLQREIRGEIRRQSQGEA